MSEREDFGRIGEGDGSFSGGVEGSEDVDEEGDKTNVGLGTRRDVEADASEEQAPSHVGESEKEEVAAAESLSRCIIVSSRFSVKATTKYSSIRTSIVQTAGKANTKLMRPEPQEARRADLVPNPDSEKMVEE